MNIESKKFFLLNSKLSSQNIHVNSEYIGLNVGDNLYLAHQLILGNYENITFPIEFKIKNGKKLLDFIDTGWPNLFLISERVVKLLIDNGFTGWKTFEVIISDKVGKEIKGYVGLSITGRCGKMIYDNAKIIEKQFVPNGPFIKFYKGVDLDINNWSKTDFFLSENYFGIITTERVAIELNKNKITNVKLRVFADIEFSLYTSHLRTKGQSL